MSSSAALTLLDLIQSHRVTSAIYVAARLGVADLLSDGAKPLGELARATGADQPALARLLAALSTIGICMRFEPDRYGLTEVGAALAADARPSFKAWAIFEGEMLSGSWSGMLDTIMTGKSAAELLGFSSSFELMARKPENVRKFNAAMADLTGLVTSDVLAAYDFSRFTHLMDVGGGSGELIGAVAKRYGHISGTVFDLPRCEEAATARLGEARRQRPRRLPRWRFFRIHAGGRGQHHSQERHSRLGRCAQLHHPAKLPAAPLRKREHCCWSSG